MKSTKGFTLIEILIVVAIIGILASIVLVGLGPARQQGADARRIADLRSMQNALELYFNRCNYYPGGPEPATPCTGWAGPPATWADLNGALAGSNIITSNVPNDPNASKTYIYSSVDGRGYVLGATLDDTANAVFVNDLDGIVQGFDCTDPVYCVQL